ncbi:Uncharacterized conserved protein, DUF885 familyt [Sphingomonas gellani]|uniref:Uncharacterized conserved protein, DUF885 familyt n=1 Tax=Sphingomonas gellani TaxID=1166340 RepID=A0A1H8C8I1_9SPHN|nr:DUF885 family protein [Sphingomonas gellani]SEM90754.1 Uncharacterized conserved protein, DUF885 familyt [Sphingomonas gellani]
MIDRRNFIGSAAAASMLTMLSGAARAAAAGGHAGLNALFDAFVAERLDRSPEMATSLGLDKDARARQRHLVTDNSAAGIAADKALTADQLRRLRAFPRSSLTGLDQVNYDAVLFGLDATVAADRQFRFGESGASTPYVLSQLTGVYQQVPTFLDTQHPIETADDAQAYLDRLSAFPRMLDNDTARAGADAAAGVIPPGFILDKALTQLTALREPGPDTARLVLSVAERTKAKGIAGDWGAKAAAIYTGQVQPALDRQIAAVRAMRAKATDAAGIGRLPQGQAYYAAALKSYTTSSLSPAEVHRLGLEQTRAYQAEIDTILKSQGLSQGSVGARLAALGTDPKQLWPDTDAAKIELIAHLNELVAQITPRLPQMFRDPPHVPLQIRRVPKEIEAGAPLGYYNPASLDGARPAIYYLNLQHTTDWPRWLVPSVTFHEGVPGHHLQNSVAFTIKDLPLIRRINWYSGYGEGWALYAEQLADELGMYRDNPLGRVGYLKSELWRACRMVLDTGIHTMGWTREQAIRWKMENDGSNESAAANEVDRYCVWPGQAPSYKIGHTVINRLRDDARKKLGNRFDIKDFHAVVLNSGAVPLDVLERLVTAYAATGKVA